MAPWTRTASPRRSSPDLHGPSRYPPPSPSGSGPRAALDDGTGQPLDPGNLADEEDRAALRKHLPPGAFVAGQPLRHARPRLSALRTADGGALLFLRPSQPGSR